jgi:hypothetical protein
VSGLLARGAWAIVALGAGCAPVEGEIEEQEAFIDELAGPPAVGPLAVAPASTCAPGTAAEIAGRAFLTVAAAVSSSAPGDVVVVCSGPWSGALTVAHPGPLWIVSASLTAPGTTISASGGARPITVSAPGAELVVQGLTLAASGVVQGDGGAVAAPGASVVWLDHVRVFSVHASGDGGVLAVPDAAPGAWIGVTASAMGRVTADGGGGGVAVSGPAYTVSLSGVDADQMAAGDAGGLVRATGGVARVALDAVDASLLDAGGVGGLAAVLARRGTLSMTSVTSFLASSGARGGQVALFADVARLGMRGVELVAGDAVEASQIALRGDRVVWVVEDSGLSAGSALGLGAVDVEARSGVVRWRRSRMDGNAAGESAGLVVRQAGLGQVDVRVEGGAWLAASAARGGAIDLRGDVPLAIIGSDFGIGNAVNRPSDIAGCPFGLGLGVSLNWAPGLPCP